MRLHRQLQGETDQFSSKLVWTDVSPTLTSEPFTYVILSRCNVENITKFSIRTVKLESKVVFQHLDSLI